MRRQLAGKLLMVVLVVCGPFEAGAALAGAPQPHGEIKNEFTNARRSTWGACRRVETNWQHLKVINKIRDARLSFDSAGQVKQQDNHIGWRNTQDGSLTNIWQSVQPWGRRVYVKIKGDLKFRPCARAPGVRGGGGGVVVPQPPARPQWDSSAVDIDLDADSDRNGRVTGILAEDRAEESFPGALVAQGAATPLILRRILPTDRPQGTVTIERSSAATVDVGYTNANGNWNRSIFAAGATVAAIPWARVSGADLNLAVRGLAVGGARITARYWNEPLYLAAEDTVVYSVLRNAAGVQIAPAIDFLKIGQKQRFGAFEKTGNRFQSVSITWQLNASTRARITPNDTRKHQFVTVEARQMSAATDDNILRVPRTGNAQATERFTIVGFAFIDDANAIIPATGTTSRLRISKVITNRLTPRAAANSFPRAAMTFAGPATGDADVFRFQASGIPAGQAANTRIRVDVLAPDGTSRISHTYRVLEGRVGTLTAYRLAEQIRLVSNPTDDGIGGARNATVVAQVGDRIRGTLIRNGAATVATELPVNLPLSASGNDAARIVDVVLNIVQPVRAATVQPRALAQWLNRDWAQAGVRFRVTTRKIPRPVSNIFLVEGTATAAGQVTYTVEGKRYVAPIARGQDAMAVAVKMAAASRGFARALRRGSSKAIVVINRGATRAPAFNHNAPPPRRDKDLHTRRFAAKRASFA